MSELPTADEARKQAMRMDITNKGGSPDVLGQKLGGSDELLALRARVAKLEEELRLARMHPYRAALKDTLGNEREER